MQTIKSSKKKNPQGFSKRQIAILEKAIAKFGINNQIIMAYEELGELIQALAKMNRVVRQTDYEAYEKYLNNLISELADVEIMTQQIKMIYDVESKVSSSKEYKIQRLNQRLKKHKL